MKTKRLLALLLAMLMVLSVVLTACGPTVINPGENPGSHEHVATDNEGNTNPEQTAQCKHAETELKNAKEATCAAPGYTGDQVCTACGTTVSTGEATAQLTHVEGEGVVTYPSTCLMPGIKTYSCTLCKEVLKTASYPASGSHDWGDWTEVKSTCVVLGYKVRTCKANGCTETEKVDLTEYGDHDLVWTDNLDGTHSADCRDCDHVVTNQAHTTVGDATWHDETCTLPGYSEGTCSLCGTYKAYDAVNHPATDHDWGEWDVKPATCVAKGSKTRACQDCSATELETFAIDTDAHTLVYKDEGDGTHTVTCANSGCQYTANANHAPAAGNTLTRYNPTCTSPAYDEGVCDTCRETYRIYVQGSTPAGHTWGEWQTVDATCTTPGSKTRTCTVAGCGGSESSVLPVVADAHVWVIDDENTVEATCQAAGVTWYVCSEEGCNETKSVDVARLPHNLGAEVVNGSFATQSCTNDGCTHIVKRTVVTDSPISSDAIKENVQEGESLEVQTGSNVAIQFPSEVVDQMTSGDAPQDVSISAGTLSEYDVNTAKDNMDAQTKELFESTAKGTVYDFNASVGGTAFDASNQFNKPVMITVPYTLTLDDPNTPENEGEDPDGIYIWYMADDGTIEKVLATFVCTNEETGEGYVWFELDHFSRYAIAYEETQEIKCRKGIHVWENKGEPVVATCVTPGYQMRECTCCHAVDFTDWVEPTGHAWENRTINPTCTEYGVTVRECKKCDAVEEIPATIVRPTGHTLPEGATASCTADVVCTSCEKVMIKGEHIWSEWITTKEPTEVTSGERKRECLRAGCDHAETITLAATGNIKPFDFESYEELVALIFDELLGFKMGTLNFKFTLANGYDVDFDVTVRKENGAYVVLVEGTADNGKKVIPFAAMYRNGALIDLSDTENVMSSADLESIIMMPFDVMMGYYENLFNMVEPMAGSIFDSADAIYDLLNTGFGAAIDAKLAAAESEFRIAEIKATIDSMRSIYAYWAMKMGWNTSVSIIGGAKIPTKADFLNVLGAFMTKTENTDGTVTYTWDPTELLEAIDTALTWIIDNKDNTFGEIIYESFGDKIAERYPELIDWAAVEAKLNQEFAGSMKLKDMIDKLLTVVEIEEIGTVDQVYRFINNVAVTAFGMESNFDVEAFIADNYDMTLDELVAFLMSMAADGEGTAPTFQQMMSGVFAMTMNDIVMPNNASLVDLAEMAKESLAGIELGADFALTVDASGRLIGMTIDQQVTMDPDGENELTIQALSLTVKADTTVQIVIPEHVKPIVNTKIETSFDEDGNLVVKVPAGYDYKLSLNGSGYVPISDVLQPDATLSAEYGCTVYLLKQGMWQKQQQIACYVLIDGKYYEYLFMAAYNASGASDDKPLTLPALAADPTLVLPDVENEEPIGIYTDGNGDDHFVYETPLNPMVQIDGVWYMLRSYSRPFGYYDEDLDLYIYVYEPDTEADLVAYEGLVNDLRVSSISNYSTIYSMGGKTIYVYDAYLTINNNDAVWGANRTIPVELYFDEDDNCVLFVRNKQNQQYEIYPMIGKQVTTLPSYDVMEDHDGNTYDGYVDANGNLVEKTCRVVYLYNMLPSYYVEITEGVYVDIAFMTTTPVLFGKTMELPDGNTLHVYRTVNWQKNAEFDRIVYGYVACGELYAQVAVLYCGEEIYDVVYRNATTQLYCNDFDAYLDINDYVTGDATNGYVIDADLIAELQAICAEYNGFSIALHCTKTVNGVNYTYYASPYTYFLMGEDLPIMGGSHSEEKENIWQGWENYGEDLVYVKNEDGSISITTADGSKLTVDYSTETSDYPVPEDIYVKNEEKSEETGLEIYDALIGAEDEKYLYLDGKYYDEYNFVSIWEPTYTSLSNLIGENWRISCLTYFAPAEYTKGDVTTPIQVYTANVYFGELSYCVLYVCIMNGKLCVLTNGTKISESTIRYDDLMPASQYLDGIAAAFAANTPTPTNETVSWYSPIYINGVKTMIYYGYVDIGASKATVFYIKNANGTISYIQEYDHMGYVLEKGSSVSIDTDAYTVTTTESWGNQKYTFVKVYAPIYVTYVKLAGKYYTYESYSNHHISENTYWNDCSEKDWYYYIEDGQGNRTYYDGVEYNGDDTFTLYDELSDLPMLITGSMNTVTYGLTADGQTIYEVSGALPRSFEELDDGTVFFYDEGETEGYLKTQAGTYLRATKIQGDEGAYIYCDFLRVGRIEDEALLISGIFDDVVTVNQMGNVVTIDAEILEMISEGFVIEINGHYVRYADLYYYLTDWEG